MSSRRSFREKEGKKPTDQGLHINLKVKGQAPASEVLFLIKRTNNLKKLMDTYCKMQSLDLESTRFHYDGRGLGRLQTPDELGMEDGGWR